MPSVYVIGGDHRERDAIVALLAKEAHYLIQPFRDVAGILAEGKLDTDGCVVVDLQAADLGAMRKLRSMSGPLPIIAISPPANVALAVQAMKEGAADFLERPIDADKLRASVRMALAASGSKNERIRRQRELVAHYLTLSARERDVVGAIMEGCGNREVASQLGIKLRTVEIHRSNAMTKLGARTLPDLVRIWLEVDATTSRLSAE